MEAERTESGIQALLQSQGELKSFHRQPNIYGPSIYTALAEYVDADYAAKAVSRLDGRNVEVSLCTTEARDIAH
jgi:hypothetical protein